MILESGLAEPLDLLKKRIQDETFHKRKQELEVESQVTEYTSKVKVQRVFNHKGKLQNFKGHVLILHTQDDRIVEFTHAERLIAWAQSSQGNSRST